MIVKELRYAIKKNKFAIASYAFLVSLFFLLTYVFFRFTNLATDRTDFFNEIYQNNEMFILRNTLFDGELRTLEFLEDQILLDQMGKFYEELNHSSDFVTLSIHNQFISIRDFSGDLIFDYRYEFSCDPFFTEPIGNY